MSSSALSIDTNDDKNVARDELPPSPSPKTNGSVTISEPTLLEEMMETVALSMLVFLLADVRLMSQTGRISLPFEWIAVDSDYLPRYNKERLAGLVNSDTSSSRSTNKKDAQDSSFAIPEECRNEGLSTAQIMACLLLELEKSVKSSREAKERAKKGNSEFSPTQRSGVDLGLKHDEFAHFAPDPTAPKEKEGMHSLLRVYAEMIGRDLNTLVPHIEARRSALNLVNSSRQHNRHESSGRAGSVPLSPVAEEGSENESEEGNEPDEAPFGKIEFGGRAARRLSQLRFENPVKQENLQRINERRKELRQGIVMNQAERSEIAFQEVTDAVFNMTDPQMSRRLHESIKKCGGFEDERVSLDPSQVRIIMEKAVASRTYKRLDFMSQFFRKGTLSNALAQGKARVVYFNDWFPLKDLTYALAVDASKKRVYVVFRGAITSQDWKKAFNFQLQKVPNPIKGDDLPKKVHIYAGFFSYLFRRRKDTGTTKYDEIASLAHYYGMTKIGEDYNLVVCGHSLGASLSTVFSFHASAEEQFTKNGPIKVFTFGSPYVGGHDFADMFRFQEMNGKIEYARFYNHNDIFAHIPIYPFPTSRGSKYRHVGIGVRVKPAPKLFPRFRTWKPHIFYVGNEKPLKSFLRGYCNSALLNTTWPHKMPTMHTLAELIHRLMEGKEYLDQKDGTDSNAFDNEALEMFLYPLSKLYQFLDEEDFKTAHA